MAEAEENLKQNKLKRRKLPHGTSEYQVCLNFSVVVFVFSLSYSLVRSFFFF